MHAGNRHPVTLHYRLPTWNAFYYIRNFAEEFWTSFCRRFSRTDTSWTSNMQVKEAFVSESSKKKKNGRQQIPENKLVVIRHHTRVVATPRRSETRPHIAEHFHWLTDITCLSRNTRCYSQVFNHFWRGPYTQFCSIPYALPFDATAWLLRSHEAVSLLKVKNINVP